MKISCLNTATVDSWGLQKNFIKITSSFHCCRVWATPNMYIKFNIYLYVIIHTIRIMASQNWCGLEIQKILSVYWSTYLSYIYKDASHLPTHEGAHGYTTSNLTSTICTRRNATCHMPLPSGAAGNFLLPFGIWPTYNISPSPRFPWNFRGFPLLFTTIWGENSCFRSRANLTRRYQVERNYRPFQGPRMLASSPPVDDVKINVQPKKNTFLCHQNASWVVWLVKSKVCETTACSMEMNQM